MRRSIIVVIESMGGGGAQQVVSSLLVHWCSNGHEVRLITFQSSKVDEFDTPSKVKRYYINQQRNTHSFFSPLLNNFRLIRELRTIMLNTNSDVILSFITQTNILCILAAVGLGRRVVVSERNDPQRQSHSIIWRILRYITYPFASLITANSKMAVDILSRSFDPKSVAFLPNPIRRSSSIIAADVKAPLLLAVGRLHPQKGYETLIKGFAQAHIRMQSWKLRILGTGPLEAELRLLAHGLGISHHVEFMGYIPDPFPHYRAASIFVMTSLYEGSPNALWEAMSCALPVIVSDGIEGALEVVTDGEDARVFPVEDPESLAILLSELASDPDACRRLGEAAVETVKQFDAPRVFDAWDQKIFSS